MARTWINGLEGKWFNTVLVEGTAFENLDANLAALVNGDGGGTWAPSSPIVVGGAGVEVLGTWNLTAADIALAESGLFPPFVLGDSDFFELTSGAANASRSLREQCAEGLGFRSLAETLTTGVEWAGAGYTITQTNQQQMGWRLNSGGFSLGVLATTFVSNNVGNGGAIPRPLSLVVPLTVHNGATFLQANLTWHVGVSHAEIPEHLPKCRLVAVDALGHMTPLNVQSTTGYDQDRYLTMPVSFTTGAGYYNSGGINFLDYICDPDVVVDTSKFVYALEIVDEWGPVNSLSGNIYTDVLCLFQDIPSMAFQL